MRVHWTETAENNLHAIHGYIAQNSPEYANRMVDRLTTRSQQIAEFTVLRQVDAYATIRDSLLHASPRSGAPCPEASFALLHGSSPTTGALCYPPYAPKIARMMPAATTEPICPATLAPSA
jgi:hypothetical protein